MREAIVVIVTAVVLAQGVVPLSRRLAYLGGGATNPGTHAQQALEARMAVPADVRRVLSRSCADCHTNDTRWPWYSRVAPASWLVINDVNHGRVHLNFSTWGRLSPAERARLLANACELVRNGSMPPRDYLFLHADAQVSSTEVAALCDWTKSAMAVDRIP